MFKSFKLLKKEDASILSKIIMNFTLPCLFFSSANGVSFNQSLIIFMLVGFAVNFIMMGVGYLLSHKEAKSLQAAYMIGCAGYDVGNFVMPFVTSFFPAIGVVYLSSFNIANTIMALGLTYAITCMVTHISHDLSASSFFKELFSSLSLDVYILILIIALFEITIPEPLITITSIIGSANTFLVMMMLGLKLEFHISKNNISHIVKLLGSRYVFAFLFPLGVMFLPLDGLAKEVMVLALLGPMVSVSSIYALKAGYEGDIVANATTLSILISMILMTGLLLVL